MKPEVLDKFTAIAGSIMNPSVDNWKKNGGKVMGYFCSQVPEELIIAAGFLPFRMRGTGSNNTNLADVYFRATSNCSFPRHCFNQALEGKYNFLDGLIIASSCDTIRLLTENWRDSSVGTPFLQMLYLPHTSGEPMAEYFRGTLGDLKAAMENHFQITIPEEKLRSAIKLCNETRVLQQQLYALRKLDNPPLTGSDMVAVMVAASSMPREQYNADLKQLIAEIGQPANTGAAPKKVRLMIVGACGDDFLLTQIIENLGATVVADHTCFGGKLILGQVDENDPDPLNALARYHIIDCPYCAKMGNTKDKKYRAVTDSIKEYLVQGIVGQRLGCCDCWAVDLYALNKKLAETGAPCLIIEREYVPASTGQIATRLQAFIETIGE